MCVARVVMVCRVFVATCACHGHAAVVAACHMIAHAAKAVVYLICQGSTHIEDAIIYLDSSKLSIIRHDLNGSSNLRVGQQHGGSAAWTDKAYIGKHEEGIGRTIVISCMAAIQGQSPRAKAVGTRRSTQQASLKRLAAKQVTCARLHAYLCGVV